MQINDLFQGSQAGLLKVFFFFFFFILEAAAAAVFLLDGVQNRAVSARPVQYGPGGSNVAQWRCLRRASVGLVADQNKFMLLLAFLVVLHLVALAVQVQVCPETPPGSMLTHRKGDHGGQYSRMLQEETAAGYNSVRCMFLCLQILYALMCSYLHQPLEDVLHLYPGHMLGTIGDPGGGKAKGRKEKREQP